MLALSVDSFRLAKKLSLVLFFSITCPILIYSHSAFAAQGSVTLTAVIEPARYIIVDSSSKIIEITTNTKQFTTPNVVLNSFSGNVLSYTTNIQVQYQRIIVECNFKKDAGIIYQNNKCSNSIDGVRSKTGSGLFNIISMLRIESLLYIL